MYEPQTTNNSTAAPKRPGFFRGRLFVAALAIIGVISALVFFASREPGGLSTSRQKIGLVEVTGVISDSTEIVRQLVKFRRDDSILGIVLRIDSPGGAVAPAQEIYAELLKFKAAKKKVFASFGTLAASGGYYIASATDRIVSNPGTLTGSIGVIMAFSNIEQLMGKIGLHPEVVKSGKFKDTGSPVRPMSGEERALLQNVVDDVYGQFVDAVAKGRKMDPAQVKKLADGRIYTGKQAFDLHLVDQLGGLEDTIDLLARAVGIDGRPKIIRERPQKSFIEWLLQTSLPQQWMGALDPLRFPSLQYLWTGAS